LCDKNQCGGELGYMAFCFRSPLKRRVRVFAQVVIQKDRTSDQKLFDFRGEIDSGKFGSDSVGQKGPGCSFFSVRLRGDLRMFAFEAPLN